MGLHSYRFKPQTMDYNFDALLFQLVGLMILMLICCFTVFVYGLIIAGCAYKKVQADIDKGNRNDEDEALDIV